MNILNRAYRFIKKTIHGQEEHATPTRSKRTRNLTLFETKTGQYYLPSDAHGDIIANTIKSDLIFDLNIYTIAQKYITQGSTALDVGSNFGQMAILMSRLVGDGGIVHAFEADDFIYEILQKNIQLNAKNITAHFGAVHHKTGEILHFPEQDFIEFDTYGSYGIDYVHGQGRPVKTLCIDDLTYKPPVSFMKIDIEGGELFALKGAIKTIKKHRMAIIFEYGSHFEEKLNSSFQDIVDFVAKINYRFERVVDNINYLIVPKEK